MAISAELIQRAKTACRISTSNANITQELTDCLEACKKDLKDIGIANINEADPLIIRAVILYVKAEFGNSNDSEKYRRSYDLLKKELSMRGDYCEAAAHAIGEKVKVTGNIYKESTFDTDIKAVANKTMYIAEVGINFFAVAEDLTSTAVGYIKKDSAL